MFCLVVSNTQIAISNSSDSTDSLWGGGGGFIVQLLQRDAAMLNPNIKESRVFHVFFIGWQKPKLSHEQNHGRMVTIHILYRRGYLL